jgi:tetratricopeptide (TPR) repeat protein
MSNALHSDTDVSRLVGEALQCLAHDELAEADAHLSRALALGPRHPMALFLKGVVESRCGHWRAAEPYFRQALLLSPAQPLICLHLAQTLRAVGRPIEAIELCRLALSTEPGNPELMLELTKSQEESGDLPAAETGLRELLRQAPATVQATLNLADLLIRCRRGDEAEAILGSALADAANGDLTPALRAEFEHRLAITLKLQRRHTEALPHLDTAARLAPHSRPIRSARAVVLQHLHRFDEAVAEYENLLAQEPLDLETHLHLNELLYRQGEDGRFLRSYDEASTRAPRSPLPLAAKGEFLLQARRPVEAKASFQSALDLEPANDSALIGMARCLEMLGDRDAAGSAYERSVAVHPESADALVAHAAYLLRSGILREAHERVSRAVALQPENQAGLAILGLCYRAMHDKREYQLNNYDAFVQVFDLEAPAGYEDMGAFNRDLSGYLDQLQTDVRENFTQTLRGGTRLYDDLFYNGHGLVDRLCARIEEAVRKYLGALRVAPNHPFTSRRSGAFTIAGSWSSRIQNAGYHLNHIHPGGWISSAYYVAVPEVSDDPAAKQGWLKFGEPTEDFGAHFSPRMTVQPRPGRLVLFPSYFWHGTVPFQSSQCRTSVAFDVLPL